MNGDFSRWTAPNAFVRGYAGVLMQQARLQTDADGNEAMEIAARRLETALADVIGRTGTPGDAGGFRIRAGSGGFRIGAGRYYLDGAMVENPAGARHDTQAGDVPIPPLSETAAADGSEVIVFLEATRAHVTAQDDARLADPALGGVDTATRIRAAWRVGVEEIALTPAARVALIRQARCGRRPDIPGWEAPTGGLMAGTVPAGDLPDDADCLIPPEAGYLSQENQLYRVQIVRGGERAQARFVWSRENGSVEAALIRNASGDLVLHGDRDDPALGFVSGGWVEVFDAADRFFGRSGRFTRITLTDGIATFSPGIGDFDQLVRPRVRRWDHGGTSVAGLQLGVTRTELERGIEVAFSDGTYAAGDFWLFEARAATGNIVWPPYPVEDPAAPLPPMGWGRRRAALALARRAGAGLTSITDLRAEFPSLTCLQAGDVGFDDGNCGLEAETVQEALDALCRRTATGLCTLVAANRADLEAGIAALAPGQSVRICLRGTAFALDRPLMLDGLGHVIVEGTGPQTVISVRDGEAALLFRNCASVRVTDLSVNGGPTGTDGRLRRSGRLGAITAIDCGDVAIERVRARCRAGLDRAAACISTLGTARTAPVLVRDCVLRVGQSQIGVNIIGASRAVVENNLITPVVVPGDLVRRRAVADPVLVARTVRGILTFPGARAPGGAVVITDATGTQRTAPAASFAHGRTAAEFRPQAGRTALRAEIPADVEPLLRRAMRVNRGDRIADEPQLRRHLRNAIAAAVRTGGRATIGGANRRILPADAFAALRASFLAQGIVIAGPRVEEARVSGNRIERATDGIRIAASSRGDRRPPDWRRTRPGNCVASAVVENNVVTVQPLSAFTTAFGIFLGHVDNASVARNDIRAATEAAGTPDRVQPHFGVHQFGYRGARLTITENTVTGLHHGYAVLPALANEISGIWRLRDNAVRAVPRPFVTVAGVSIV